MDETEEETGQRSVEAQVDVAGSAEEVWHAIASGPGISSWFVPTELEEREGGVLTCCFGPEQETRARITRWDPPRSFASEARESPDQPLVETEWSVEPLPHGKCTVRVSHTWTAEDDSWDEQFEGHAAGWYAFFHVLEAYMAFFAAEPCAAFQLLAASPEPPEPAFEAVARALGVGQLQQGARLRAPDAGAPALAGRVEHAGDELASEQLLLRLEQPCPGLLHLFAMPDEGLVLLPVRVFLYGERAAACAEVEEPRWRAWLEQHFPLPG